MKKSSSKVISTIVISLVLVFLFAPMLVLIVFSFNSGNSTAAFDEFSLYWYGVLFRDAETLNALKNSVILAVTSAAISTLMGTAAAYGLGKMRKKYLKNSIMSVTNIPMMNPDIITGISLMLMFVFVGTMLGFSDKLSFWTMLIAHITFELPYVIMSVLPKINQMDKSLPEAAMDLGCTPLETFLKVEIPEIFPGILSGAIMAFTMSLDDFVISYFTKGSSFQTLPLLIYSMTKKRVTPKIYALATIIFVVILTLLIVSNLMGTKEERLRVKMAKHEKKMARRLNNKSLA